VVKIGPFEINLIPKPSWGKKIETILGKDAWRAIRERELKRAGYKCEICGSRQKPLHVHELWEFDEEKGLQILKGLIVVCEKCHLVFHLGYANTQGRLKEAIEHLVRITGIKYDEAKALVEKAFDEWVRRSRREWKIIIPDDLHIKVKRDNRQATLDKWLASSKS